MSSIRQILTLVAIITTTTFGTCGVVQAGKYKVLHSFCQSSHNHPCGDGSNPQGSLVMDAVGNLYGVTPNAGAEFGTVFELERKGSGGFKFRTIYRFCQSGFCGMDANGPLIMDTSGNLYGTANNLVFELSPQAGKKNWVETILYRFCSQNCVDGNVPSGGLTYVGASSGQLYDGISPLYGVTVAGGNDAVGVVFELSKSSGVWSETVIHNFCAEGATCPNGKTPISGLLMTAAGVLYGTAVQGGNNNGGLVYTLSESGDTWSYTVLYRFCSESSCSDGAGPGGPLVMDGSGNLYGVTGGGGRICKEDRVSGCGTIFKIVPGGSESEETVLYAFCAEKKCKDGRGPVAGLVLDSFGNLYGTTAYGGGNNIDQSAVGGGTAFRYDGSTLKVLHRFCSEANCADGEYPAAPLVIDGAGKLFGTTSYGGEFGGSTFGGIAFQIAQ